jgi:hypothetical protein
LGKIDVFLWRGIVDSTLYLTRFGSVYLEEKQYWVLEPRMTGRSLMPGCKVLDAWAFIPAQKLQPLDNCKSSFGTVGTN